jgi:GcrA cell cycle regulator
MTHGVPLDLAGRTFGRLTVISRAERPVQPMGVTMATSKWWLCRCDCGVVAVKNGPELAAGRINSCGGHLRGNAAGSPRWNDATIQALRDLWTAGYSTSEIGRRLGFSKNAIVGKAHRLDLDGRPSPIRRDSPPRAIPTAPRAIGQTLPPLPSDTQTVGIVPMAESGYRIAAIAQAMRVDVRSVQAVIPRPAPLLPVMQKPLPVSLVPLRAPTPVRSGATCQWPIGEPGTKAFRFCDDASMAGKPYCCEHAKLAYVRIRDRKEDVAA